MLILYFVKIMNYKRRNKTYLKLSVITDLIKFLQSRLLKNAQNFLLQANYKAG